MKLISSRSLQKIIETDKTQRDFSTTNYYHPLLKHLYLSRIHLGLSLLATQKYKKMLDLGFGGGIIIPELAQHCDQFYGVDIHKNITLINKLLKSEGVANVTLLQTTNNRLPFPDSYFDCLWCLSVLEFVNNPSELLMEIKRVTKKEADIIIGFPIANKLTTLAYWLLGFDSDKQHKNTHSELIKEIKNIFKIETNLVLPAWLPLDFSLFCVLKIKQ
ncbi:MAG: methyltransferase domain-containing protein [Candidatus Buchananbacteria bacterium]